jgi:ribonuclease G
MTRRLLLAVSPGEIWAALTENDELVGLRLARTFGAARPGDLYLGRVVALRPELPAVLVDIGEERPAFLSGEDVPRGAKLREGEAVTVKVLKAARADKAAGLTTKLDADEQKFAVTGAPPKLLWRRETPLDSLLKEFSADEITIDDTAALAELKRNFAGIVTLHSGATPLFEAEGVAAAIETTMAARVALPKDGAITIEATAAAILVDVDGGRGGALAANLAAASEIGRQIRLRDLSGPIVIDFISMKERGHRTRVEAALKEAVGEGAQYLGWTRLGHFELVLKRRRASLMEMLFEHRPGAASVKTALMVALDALRQLQRESRAAPGKRFGLQVHPEIAACLDREAGEARRDLEARLGHAIKIVTETRPRDSVAVVDVSLPR